MKGYKVLLGEGMNEIHIKTVLDSPLPWSSSNLSSRSHEITMTRLRIRHTRLTHTHLFTHLMSLSCPHCDRDSPLSVEHIFVCPDLTSLRDSHHIPHSHTDALSHSSSCLPDIVVYLHHAGFLPVSYTHLTLPTIYSV